MNNRYNIALIPVSKQADFVNFAKKYLYDIAGNYRLGSKSIPHITLCQFMAAESDIEGIWKKVCESSFDPSIELILKDFSCITVDNSSWVSLLPDNLDALMKLHCEVANLIESRIGRCFKKYDAHMTLINTNQENYKDLVSSLSYAPIQDMFILALGRSDAIGQFKEVLYSCNVEESKKLLMLR